MTVVAVIAAGMMGAAVGRRLADHGIKVLTSLAGRGGSTADRAKEAHMVAANDSEIAAADFLLSIVPPGDALSLAERFAPALKASNAKPIYVDCNAINPATVGREAAVIAPTGCSFVDCGIIGPPPPRLSPSQLAGRSDLCRLQRHQSGACRPGGRVDRADGMLVRRLRHYRAAAATPFAFAVSGQIGFMSIATPSIGRLSAGWPR